MTCPAAADYIFCSAPDEDSETPQSSNAVSYDWPMAGNRAPWGVILELGSDAGVRIKPRAGALVRPVVKREDAEPVVGLESVTFADAY